ncbi:MAG: type II toxin-antitoxin system RelE family toxin [Pseudonocardiaceae bacterium]|jgi:mRNA-degrading endonuclease RelE of RelBE toxin-antitoxin system
MRLRIGDYRVVYVVRDDMVLVTVVHRREAYRGR